MKLDKWRRLRYSTCLNVGEVSFCQMNSERILHWAGLSGLPLPPTGNILL